MFQHFGKGETQGLVSTSPSIEDGARKGKRRNSSKAFHRRQSYLPVDSKGKSRWLVYDNDGSFNGWFDWLPIEYRVGYWSPFVVLSIIGFYTALFTLKPQLDFPATVLDNKVGGSSVLGMPRATAADLGVFLWGILVMVQAKLSLGTMGAFPISFTGWSWLLLTFRAGFEFSAWAADSHGHIRLATNLAKIGSSIRLAAISNAAVVCLVWNFVLLPILLLKAIPKGEKRDGFLKFNFGFFMTNVHVLNLPLASIHTVIGSNTRLFTHVDLWVSYLVLLLYSVLYFFGLDRFGLHFYPIFNPRTSWSVLSILLVLGLYYKMFNTWNGFIAEQIFVGSKF